MNNYKALVVCKTDDIKYTDDYDFKDIKQVSCNGTFITLITSKGTLVKIPKENVISLHVSYIAELEVNP